MKGNRTLYGDPIWIVEDFRVRPKWWHIHRWITGTRKTGNILADGQCVKQKDGKWHMNRRTLAMLCTISEFTSSPATGEGACSPPPSRTP